MAGGAGGRQPPSVVVVSSSKSERRQAGQTASADWLREREAPAEMLAATMRKHTHGLSSINVI